MIQQPKDMPERTPVRPFSNRIRKIMSESKIIDNLCHAVSLSNGNTIDVLCYGFSKSNSEFLGLLTMSDDWVYNVQLHWADNERDIICAATKYDAVVVGDAGIDTNPFKLLSQYRKGTMISVSGIDDDAQRLVDIELSKLEKPPEREAIPQSLLDNMEELRANRPW